MIPLLVSFLVTAISLFIISKLPLGVEIDSISKALVSAVVFGIINGVLHFLALPINFITFGLFSWIINIIAFGLAAALVTGFRLRWGFWSALIGSFALSVINSIINNLLTTVVS